MQKYVAYSAFVSSDAAVCSSFSELHLCKPEPGTRMRCCRAACVGPECFADGSGGFHSAAPFGGARVSNWSCEGQGSAASKLFMRGADLVARGRRSAFVQGRGVPYVESLHGERGCVRGPRARRLERWVLLFPIVSACRMLASGCVSVKGKASSGGGKKDNPKTVRPSGCRLGQVPAISFLASGRRCRVQGCGTVRIPPANSPASSRRACRSSPTSSVR